MHIIKNNKAILITALLASTMLFSGCDSIFTHSNSTQQQNQQSIVPKLISAINNISTNPLQAEKELLSVNAPTAKAYLAYLYFTDKVKTEKKTEKTNLLMNEAIKEAFKDNKAFSYGPINAYQTYSYEDLEFLLTHIRLIQELDYKKGMKTEIPSWLFSEHPKEAYNAFSPAWENIKTDYVVPFTDFNSIDKLPEVRALIAEAYKTRKSLKLESNNPRLYEVRLLIASSAPKYELTLNDKARYKKLWSLLPANKTLVKAQNSLSKYYISQFHLSEAIANEAAYIALSSLFEAKSGMFSRNSLELYDRYLYKAAYSSDTNIKELSAYLKTKKPSQPYLNEALSLALQISQNIDVIRLLLISGAKVDKTDKQTLIEAGNFLVKIISSAKPFGNPNYFGTPDTLPNGQILALVKLFLKAGIPIDNADKSGETLLISSAKANNTDLARFLINNGANVNKVTDYHYSALYWVTRNSDSDISLAKLLVENGANVNFKDENEETPLMQAVDRGNANLVKYLISHKASVHSCNGVNRTVLEFARDDEIRNMLIKAGATK